MDMRFLAKCAMTAAVATYGLALLARRVGPQPSDIMEGAIHFRNGMKEFQHGFMTMVFGSSKPSPEEAAKMREANRIMIE